MGYYSSYSNGSYSLVRTLSKFTGDPLFTSSSEVQTSLPTIVLDESTGGFKYIVGTLFQSSLGRLWKVYSAENTRLGSSRSGSTPSMQIIDKGSGYVAFYAPSGNLGPPGTVWWKAFDGFNTSYANPIGGSGSNYLWFSYSGEENFVDNTIDNFSIVNGTPYYFYKAFNPEISTTLVYKSTVKFLDSVIDAANNVGELQIQSYLGYGYVRWYPLGNNYSLSNVVLNDAEPSSPEYVDNSPYSPGGNSGVGGGDGTFGKDETSDDVSGSIPSGTVAGDASANGMLTRYLMNNSYLNLIGDWLWTEDLGLAIAKAGISFIYGSPSESLISLMAYPFDISSMSKVSYKDQNIFWGGFDSRISAKALTSSAAQIDWGTIQLTEYWGNFLDYEPHTKIELYLPWSTGFVSIDPNQCLPGTLQIITNIDLSKGSCIHNVIGNNGCVIGVYTGQCSQQIPLMSTDTASKMAGLVVGATALAVSGIAGRESISAGLGAAIEYDRKANFSFYDAAGMAAYKAGMAKAEAEAIEPYRKTQKAAGKLAAASSVAALKRSGIIARNGGFSDGSSALSIQYPYVIVSRPSQSVPEQYGSHYGYPSNIYSSLASLSGYTEIGEIHLDGIPGTDAELSELDRILKGGVIL